MYKKMTTCWKEFVVFKVKLINETENIGESLCHITVTKHDKYILYNDNKTEIYSNVHIFFNGALDLLRFNTSLQEIVQNIA